jgi:hypothetical protein
MIEPRQALKGTNEAMSLQFEAGMRIISLLFLIASASCTTWAPPDPSPWRWRKERVTVEHQRRDQAECANSFRPGLQCLDWGYRGAGRHREPGRRGLLSGEGLLFAGALILVVARQSAKVARAQGGGADHQARPCSIPGTDIAVMARQVDGMALLGESRGRTGQVVIAWTKSLPGSRSRTDVLSFPRHGPCLSRLGSGCWP